MKEKYTNIITEIVKQHHRFLGLEEILSEIVEDVYNHANAVLSTIDNEDVLHGYLAKLVSTSIITVPRKLNINNRRNASSLESILKEAGDKEETTSKEPEFSLETKLQEEISEESFDVIETQEEDYNDVNNIIEDEQEEDLDEAIVEDSIEELKPFENEQELESIDVHEEAIEETEENILVDQSLVEKMINGVTTNIQDYEEDNSENLSDFSDENFQDTESGIDLIEDLEDIDKIEVIDTVEEEDIVQDNLFESIENDLTIEEDEMEPIRIEPEVDVIEEIINEDFASIYSETDLNEDFSNDVIVDNNINESEYSEFIAPDGFYDRFSQFDFTPILCNFDSTDICKKLSKLDSIHSELHILKVCELKFYQNKSVVDIANILEMTQSNVIEALNKIINEVKD